MAVRKIAEVKGISLGFEEVGPERARELLERNSLNRRLSPRLVEKYAADMVTGHWLVNGETITISKEGHVINGQHRLHAVIEAKVKVPLLIVQGVEEEAFFTIDTGKSRSIADVLGVLGFSQSLKFATLARFWLLYERGGTFKEPAGRDRTFTIQEMLEAATANRETFHTAINALTPLHKKLGHLSGVWNTLWIKFGEINEADRDYFFHRLQDGDGLDSDSPILALREHMLEDRRSGRFYTGWSQGLLTIKAWNAFRAKQPLKRLSFVVSSSAGNEYPEPI